MYDSRLEEVEEEIYIELAEQSHKSGNEDICEDVIQMLQEQKAGFNVVLNIENLILIVSREIW